MVHHDLLIYNISIYIYNNNINILLSIKRVIYYIQLLYYIVFYFIVDIIPI